MSREFAMQGGKKSVRGRLDCSSKNTTDEVAYTQQKFIPHGFGGWGFQDQGVQCLVRTHFLAHTWLSSCHILI